MDDLNGKVAVVTGGGSGTHPEVHADLVERARDPEAFLASQIQRVTEQDASREGAGSE
jgi:hypothetical protein